MTQPTLRLVISHSLAMTLAVLLALALSSCSGSERPASESSTRTEGSSVSTHDEVASADEVLPTVEADAGPPNVDAGTEAGASNIEPAEERELATPRVLRASVALDVDEREPVGAASTFSQDDLDRGRLYGFYALRNMSDDDAAARVVFISPSGRRHGSVVLEVPAGARRYRTWAFTRAAGNENAERGSWTAQLESMDGEVLDEQDFELTE